MATLSATTAASLLVGLMAIAPKPGTGRSTAPERPGRSADHGQTDSARRTTPAALSPRVSRA